MGRGEGKIITPICLYGEEQQLPNMHPFSVVVLFSKHEGPMTSWCCVWGNTLSLNEYLEGEVS